jgi:hypothetical protein
MCIHALSIMRCSCAEAEGRGAGGGHGVPGLRSGYRQRQQRQRRGQQLRRRRVVSAPASSSFLLDMPMAICLVCIRPTSRAAYLACAALALHSSTQSCGCHATQFGAMRNRNHGMMCARELCSVHRIRPEVGKLLAA